ncbi:hypothetical protein [Brevundimonas sp. SGAir0440]|uniref:hypothetical protein n=1 Tax=Brevundimonas sp. SGAir0440 TaxID=2579977 RepID=UPI0010CD3805|nr:hypothetical protein [Brevundimonas sp. SGAir0440]QCQ98023.1 hypothetical protein E7T10_04745 [Brevundimonas sp. SGAir0440]
MAVLGIDAAWTLREPSGVALISKSGSRWRLLAAAPSYESFIAITGGANPSGDRPRGSEPDLSGLLSAAARVAGVEVDLIAVDMHKEIARTFEAVLLDEGVTSQDAEFLHCPLDSG